MAGNARSGRRNRDPLVVGGRIYLRALVDNPDYRTQFTAQFERAITGEDPIKAVEAFLKIFEHGYGRPPQALDVKVGNSDGPLEFRILDVAGADFAFGGGDLPTRAVPLPTGVTE